VASGQYTPRVIATTLLRDNVIRFTVGLFVFTMLFSISALNRTEETVRQTVIVLTGLLGLLHIAGFLFLIDYAARLLRPVSLVRRVGEDGWKVLAKVYPLRLETAEDGRREQRPDGELRKTVTHHGTSAIVVAVDLPRLVSEAEKADGTIEFVPQVGDFAGVGEPLFRLFGGAAGSDERVLREAVDLGSERTMEQDPLFALRILADIGIKALSKAINDPTTAVLAIDQLQRLMSRAGQRDLRSDFIDGQAGKLRVIFHTPDWDDFVHLAFCEIRFYGAENIQIARRLRAMLLHLIQRLPAVRHPALRQEFELLDRAVAKLYEFPEDLALARIPDSQGLGGSTEQGGAGSLGGYPREQA
jgi:uncharacterized membrane protein